MRIHRMLAFLAVLALAVGLAACDDDPTGSGAEGPGTLRLSLIDAPAMIPGVEALHLTVSAVRVHADDGTVGGTWYEMLPDTLTVEERTFDLLELVNGEMLVIGEDQLPAGRYDQIRLVLEDASVTVDGKVYGLKVPSGTTSGLKLVNEFRVLPGGLTGLVLDFDVARSLLATPPGSTNFKLKPVIRVLSEQLAGRIVGSVLPVDIDAMVMAVSADEADTATTPVEAGTGGFVLGALAPGLWDVTAMAPGYLDSTVVDVRVMVGADSGPIDFTLQPEPQDQQ